MTILDAQIIEKNGKKIFAVLPYEDYLKAREQLEDYNELCCLREAKAAEGNKPTISLAAMKNRRKRAKPAK